MARGHAVRSSRASGRLLLGVVAVAAASHFCIAVAWLLPSPGSHQPGFSSSLCGGSCDGGRLGGGGRSPSVAQEAFPAPQMVFMAFGLLIILAQPKSAPGPSAELLARERQIRRDLAAANVAVNSAQNKEAKHEAQRKIDDLERKLHDMKQQLEECGADLRAYPIPEYLRDACAAGHVMVAVTGGSGVGKSSWINVVRRVGPKDAIAAATGVTETTPEPHMYPFRGPGRRGGIVRQAFRRVAEGTKALASRVFKGKAPEAPAEPAVCVGDQVLLHGVADSLENAVVEVTADLGGDRWEVRLEDGSTKKVLRSQMAGILPECVLWDLPGVGTPNFPKETYLKDMGVRHFDMVVLMTAERFTEAELDLLKELEFWGVPYFLVRNKTDMDVENEIEKEEDSSPDGTLSDERRREVEAATIKKIKDFFKKDFDLERIYCISARRRLVDQFDFRQLEQDMEATLRQQRFLQGEEAEALGASVEVLREEQKEAEEVLASTAEQATAREEASEPTADEEAAEAVASTDEPATARQEAEGPSQQSSGGVSSSSSSSSAEVGSSVAANDQSSVLASQAPSASEMKRRFLEDMKRAAGPGR